jgi:Uri superfamily endonuclease
VRGVYTLIIRFLFPCSFNIGKCLSARLDEGTYLYTGSGLGLGSTSLEGRIRRHLRQEKRTFWHIDWILACKQAEVRAVVFAESEHNAECRVNEVLLKDQSISVRVKGIGSSDCVCASHFLAFSRSTRLAAQVVKSCYESLGLAPRVLTFGHLRGRVRISSSQR